MCVWPAVDLSWRARLNAHGVHVRSQEIAECCVHRLVALPCRLASKSFCHDKDAKVPAAARAGVPDMSGAVVHDLEMLRSEHTLKRGTDAFDSIRAHRTPDSSGDSGCGTLFIAIQTPCAMEKASVSPMPPKSLNFTQNASLKL